jgi:hypothetical protein
MRVHSTALRSGNFRPSIGHNGGPPLDLSWTAWNWRRAHAEAWKPPGREIALLRLRRAEQLGLSYRAYTSVLLDRGVRLAGVIVMLNGASLSQPDPIARKLSSLQDCVVIVCGDTDIATPDFFAPADCRSCNRDALAGTLADAASGTTPSAFFMVGTTEADEAIARTLGIGLFVDARDYFNLD